MNYKYTKLSKALSLLSMLLAIPAAFASGPIVPTSGNTGLFYYQLGGGSNVPMPAILDTQTIPLSVGANVGLGYNCGVFNPTLSIENALNGIKNSVINMGQSVITNATGAIYNMPLYFIARANHTAYDILTNQFFNAQTQLQVSTKSCQVMQSEISQGQNPYNNWAKVAIGDDWKKSMGLSFGDSAADTMSDGEDINLVKQQVDQNDGNQGVPWIEGASSTSTGQNAGGAGQPPIQVVHDTVLAGYNALLQAGRDYDDQSAPAATSADAYLVNIWPTPVDAANWIVNVIGDQEITTYPGGAKQSTPGVGLLADVYTQTQSIQTALTNLISGQTPDTIANLQALASPSMVLSKQAVQAFQQLGAVDQDIYIHKLAEAMAAEKVAEKVRIAKQILMVGESIPEIAGNSAAITSITARLKKLTAYRNNMTFNNGQIFGSAAKVVEAVITMTNTQAANALSSQPGTNSGAGLQNGAISKSGDSL